MKETTIRGILIWGFIMWLVGYLLGIMLFPFVPVSVVGWIIMPMGLIIILWVLAKKITFSGFNNYLVLGLVWVLMAVIFDYLFLVKVFKPADGYYKLDVYLYYLFTFLVPVVIGWKRVGLKND